MSEATNMQQAGTRQGTSHPQGDGRIRTHLLVLASYVALAVVLTYPLILHITTHVPGDGRDDPPLVWNLWWVRYALLNLHTNPLVCPYLFYPIGVNLTFFTLTIVNALLSVPLQMTAGVVLASNANLLVSYAIGGFGAYLLALDVLKACKTPSTFRDAGNLSPLSLAAFVAGLVYAFAPIKMIFASLGQFNMTSTQWIPFCVLYLVRLTRPAPSRPTGYDASGLTPLGGAKPTPLRRLSTLLLGDDRQGRRDALLASLFLLLTAYAELTFASFVLIFLAVYLGYLLVTRRSPVLTRRMFGRLTVFGLAFVIGLWPILGSMLREMAIEGDYSLTAGWGFADIFVADLLGFFLPSHLHPILGGFAQRASQSFSYTNFASTGLVVLALAGVGLAAQRRKAGEHATAPRVFWGLAALLYAVLSLGPVLHIAGRWVFNLDGLLVRIPLPFIILHYVPFIKANRYPSRLQVFVILCLSVLVAYGVAAILNRTQTHADKTQKNADRGPSSGSDGLRSVSVSQRSVVLVTIVLVGAILFEYLAVPLPLSDMRTPEVYARIAQDNGNAPVLQLPISWRNSFQFIPQSFTALPQSVNTVVMFEQFYQTTHQGPILSGNTSRNPEFKFTYFLQAPIVRSLVTLEEGRALSAEQMAYDRSIMPEVLRFFGFKYIVLHPPLVGGPVEDYVRAVFPVEPIPADEGLSAYRVIAPPTADRLTIDMGSDLSNLYRAEGWGEAQSIADNAGATQVGRWTDRRDARLLVPLAEQSSLQLTIKLYSYEYYRRIQISMNGQRVSDGLEVGVNRRLEWTELQVDVPRTVTRAGLNELLVTSYNPDDIVLSGWRQVTNRVGQTNVQTTANIVAHSAGLDAGGDLGFAHIYVNGKDAISGRRGLNVAVIDPATGRVQSTACFDLSGDVGADGKLLDFIKAVPEGRIVAVAVMDDASISFGEGSLAALRLIGAQADLRGRLRNSYAAIGVKGATPGQALEQWAQGRPASVAVGAHVFGRELGVAVSQVIVELREAR